MNSRMRSLCLALAVVGVLSAAGPARVLALNYSEGVDGDLSGDVGSPTALGTLGIGAHTLDAAFGAGDFDLFSFTIGPGRALSSIILDSFDGTLAFAGLQSGPIWTTALGGAIDPTTLLGWTHLAAGQVGGDVLQAMGEGGAGAIGFTGPLSAGTYTILLQETGPTTVAAGLTLNVVPEPSLLVLGVIGATAWGWRRHSRLQARALRTRA